MLLGVITASLVFAKNAITSVLVTDVVQVVVQEPSSGGGAYLNPKLLTIAEISIDDITSNSIVFSWRTNRAAQARVSYGIVGVEKTTNIEILTPNILHQYRFSGLIPESIYIFRITAFDANGVETLSDDIMISTSSLPDTIPPANVSGVSSEIDHNNVTLNWINPSDEDFMYIRVERRTDTAVYTPGTGVLVYEGNQTEVTENNLLFGEEYLYTIFAFDNENNYSSGTFIRVRIPLIAEENIITSPITPDDEVNILPTDENVNPVIDEENPLVDVIQTEKEIILDDNNSSIQVLGFNDKTSFSISEDGYSVFEGTNMKIAVPKEFLGSSIVSSRFVLSGDEYLMRYDKEMTAYTTTVVIPHTNGSSSGEVHMTFFDGTKSYFTIPFNVYAFGEVVQEKNGMKLPVANAQISLYLHNPGELWNAETSGQKNPQQTKEDGLYGFVVEPGHYDLSVESSGLDAVYVKDVEVSHGLINIPVVLVPTRTHRTLYFVLIISLSLTCFSGLYLLFKKI